MKKPAKTAESNSQEKVNSDPAAEYWWRTAYFTDFKAKIRKEQDSFDVQAAAWQMEERAAWLYRQCAACPK